MTANPAQGNLFAGFSDEKPASRNILAFDLETRLSADEVGGWGNIREMRLAIGVTCDIDTGEFQVYEEKDAAALITCLKSANLVVGFNTIKFDYTVLEKYADFGLEPMIKSFDILLDVSARLGFRLKLESLATATLGAGKSASGLQSLEWFRNGEVQKVIDYCKKDVEVTRDLFLRGVKDGEVLYTSKFGGNQRLKVDWNIDKLLKKPPRVSEYPV